ncbi:hypothetical protein ACM0AU_17750 [Mycobacteroides abscessus subsp. abscessus]|uniref:hypothetical protein n=1 Tax=Mycobacteroides abscessus TaxID=36809 RepID=UPI0039EED28A
MTDETGDYDRFNAEHNHRFAQASDRLDPFFGEISDLLAAACSPAIAEAISSATICVEDGANSYSASFAGATTIRIGETFFDIVYAVSALIESAKPQAPPALTGPFAEHLHRLLAQLRNDSAPVSEFGPTGPLAEIGPLGPIDLRRAHYTLQYWMNVATGCASVLPELSVDDNLLDRDRRLRPEYQIPEDIKDRMDALAGVARFFAVAHEYAHVLLGHTSAMTAIPEIAAQAKAIIGSSGALADQLDDIELQADVIGLSMVMAFMRFHSPATPGAVIAEDLLGPITVLGQTFDIAHNPDHLRQLGADATHPSAHDREAILKHTANYLGTLSHPNLCYRNH